MHLEFCNISLQNSFKLVAKPRCLIRNDNYVIGFLIAVMNMYLGLTRVYRREKSREDLVHMTLRAVISPLLMKFTFLNLHQASCHDLKNEFIESKNCMSVSI